MPLVVLLASALSSAALIVAPEAAPAALCAGASECPFEPPDADAAGRRHRGPCGGAPRRRHGTCRFGRPLPGRSPIVAAAALLLALVGAVDDIRPLPAATAASPADHRRRDGVFSPRICASCPGAIPSWLDKTILILAGVWFVNLVNFMDGLDWITVAEIVPVTAFLALARPRRHPARAGRARRGRALRGDARLCALQQAGREALPRRCRLAAARPCRRMAPCCSLPPQARSRRRSCSRSTISPTRRSRSCAASPAASGCGRRIAATSTSRRPTTAFRRSR